MADAPPRRRRGRPPTVCLEGTTHVSFRLSNGAYDELYAYAQAHGLNIAVVIRRAIDLQIVADRRELPRD